MPQDKHDDPRSDDQRQGDRSGLGPRDGEHRDGARKGADLSQALDKTPKREKPGGRRETGR